jgi:hypothetical protein
MNNNERQEGIRYFTSIRSFSNGKVMETEEKISKCFIKTKKCEVSTKFYSTPISEFNEGKVSSIPLKNKRKS